MKQLKDSFQGYGIVSILLKFITLLLIAFLHINFIVNIIINKLYYRNLELSLLSLIFIVLVLRFIWHKLNSRTPIILTSSIGTNFTIKLVKIIAWTSVILLTIFSLLLFFIDSYEEYYANVLNKIDFYFFHVKIIPFNVIQLICYSIERIFNIDIAKIYPIISIFRIITYYVLAFLSCVYIVMCIIFFPRSEQRRLL